MSLLYHRPGRIATIAFAFIMFLLLGASTNLILSKTVAGDFGVTSGEYVDPTDDVYDNLNAVLVSDRHAYDIINASIQTADDVTVLTLGLLGPVDNDGYYIFQCDISGNGGYIFSYSTGVFAGSAPDGAGISVTGYATPTLIRIYVSEAALMVPDGLALDNVSAQSNDLRYIDVLDCIGAVPANLKAYTDCTLTVGSKGLIILEYTTTYSDTTPIKKAMDKNGDGYVSAQESFDFSQEVQQKTTTYIIDNKDGYYNSMIYADDFRPRDITVQSDCYIADPDTDVMDLSSISTRLYISYQNEWGSSVMLSLPFDILFSAPAESSVTIRSFKMTLNNGITFDRDTTAPSLRGYIQNDPTNLTLSSTDIASIEKKRTDVSLTCPTGSNSSSNVWTYVIIAMVSVTIAFCIFVGYNMLKKSKEPAEEVERGKGAKITKGKKGKQARDNGDVQQSRARTGKGPRDTEPAGQGWGRKGKNSQAGKKRKEKGGD
jgi:hypothetical protein